MGFSCARNHFLVKVLGPVVSLTVTKLRVRSSEADVARLKSLIQSFARSFGLLVTRQTPCGLPISPSHAHCLMVLLERERAGLETSQFELGDRLSIDKSNVARLCGKLHQDGHAVQTRSPSDGRGRLIRLTLKGKRMAERLETASDERFRRILKAVAPDERGPLLTSLETLTAALRLLDEEVEP